MVILPTVMMNEPIFWAIALGMPTGAVLTLFAKAATYKFAKYRFRKTFALKADSNADSIWSYILGS